MNSLITNQPLTMSSREIAEYTGKQHQHVKRDIENMFMELGLDVSKIGRIYKDSMNRNQTEYFLDRDQTDCLLTGYSAKARMKVIKRWKELEESQKPQLPDFNNPAESARAWADQYEQNQVKQKQLELAAPKVAFVDNYVETGTTKTLRETAKILKYPERKMIAKMLDDKVLYRQSGNLLPYQDKHEKGLFDLKTGERGGYAYTQTRVTTKGIEWLANRYASELM